MLSSNLVELIQEHSDAISSRIVQEVRDNPKLPHMGKLPEDELCARARDILEHLGHWLLVSAEREVANHFEQLGARRFEEGIPLAEVALAYMTVKTQMLQFVREQGIGGTTLELYAEEELEYVISRFFDLILYEMIKGYEDAGAQAHMENRDAGHTKRTAAKRISHVTRKSESFGSE